MSYGPFDLRLTAALAERRLLAARLVRVGPDRRPSARGASPERSSGRGLVPFRRTAPGAAGHR
jgi:hypothetical protein